MTPIGGKAKTLRELLKGVKYSIDYYQREYRWEAKQLLELLNDLSGMFLKEYEPGIDRKRVADFPHYFLGSIIISQKETQRFIVDGQQRLTSLTLLLVLLRSLQRDRSDAVSVDDLVFSEQYGEKTFNLVVDERALCMRALFDGEAFDATDYSESVQNLHERYQDLESHFPEDLTGDALPYFVDWLVENVYLVEISAASDEDAYTIFETMNDRGLSLSPTEMLKGYLLANMEPAGRSGTNNLWRNRIQELKAAGDDRGADFFKAWLRSQYATKIRERKKGATAEDFDRLGTEFHRWLRETHEALGLHHPVDFLRFVEENFDFYSRQYLTIRQAQEKPIAGFEHIFYNQGLRFTLQDMLLLAPLQPRDSEPTIECKLRLVARFVDIRLAWRIWNFRSIDYSTMQYAMFTVMRDIRGLDPKPLAEQLHRTLLKESETFPSNDRLRMHRQNRWQLHRLLARMTDYAETHSGRSSRYLDYVAIGKNRYEIEHIWANHPEQHADELPYPADFAEERNRIGGLLLLPKSFNASYSDLSYEKKLPHYFKQNLLASSLHPQAYERDPGFHRFRNESGLPFQAHAQFKQADIKRRGELYQQLAELIWNPEDLLGEVGE